MAGKLTGSSRVNPAAHQHRGAAGVFVAPRLFCRSCGVMEGAAGLGLCPESTQSTSGKAAALPVLETLLRQAGLQHLQAGFVQSSCARWTRVAPGQLLTHCLWWDPGSEPCSGTSRQSCGPSQRSEGLGGGIRKPPSDSRYFTGHKRVEC